MEELTEIHVRKSVLSLLLTEQEDGEMLDDTIERLVNVRNGGHGSE